jgi:hypothetical protein
MFGLSARARSSARCRTHRGGPGPVAPGKFSADLRGDAGGHVVLQPQNVAQLAVVAIGPDLILLRAVDELRGHSDPIARACDGAGDERIDA